MSSIKNINITKPVTVKTPKEETNKHNHISTFRKLPIRMPIEKIILTDEEIIEILTINKEIDDLQTLKTIEQNVLEEIISLHPDLSEIIYEFKNIDNMSRRISELKNNRIYLCKQRENVIDRQKKIEQQFGFRSSFDVENRISELLDEIEFSTMSNKQLKQKLAEIDRLKERLRVLQRFDDVDNDLEELNEEIESISEEIKNLSEIISIIDSKLDLNPNLNEEIKFLFKERNDQQNQINNSVKYFNNIDNKIERLKHEKNSIYFLGERRMNEQHSNDRKMRLQKIKVHPNQKKIDIARALVEYLNRFQTQTQTQTQTQSENNNENVDTQNQNNQNCSNDDDEFSMMIRNTRNNRNPKQISKTKKSSNFSFSFSLETIDQFMTLGLNLPSSLENIHQTITHLNSIIETFEAEPLVTLYDIHN
jgi:hypothetical protein